jgi:hypothetical protein
MIDPMNLNCVGPATGGKKYAAIFITPGSVPRQCTAWLARNMTEHHLRHCMSIQLTIEPLIFYSISRGNIANNLSRFPFRKMMLPWMLSCSIDYIRIYNDLLNFTEMQKMCGAMF